MADKAIKGDPMLRTNIIFYTKSQAFLLKISGKKMVWIGFWYKKAGFNAMNRDCKINFASLCNYFYFNEL
jgi:hypothetical protein